VTIDQWKHVYFSNDPYNGLAHQSRKHVIIVLNRLDMQPGPNLRDWSYGPRLVDIPLVETKIRTH
jgi:hypothetical protein